VTEPRGAAFFDLDKTLMQGSSAFEFGRAAYRAGLMSRRQLAADAIANLRFRLHGATDDVSEALRDRIALSLEGVRVRDLERLGVTVLAGILPRLYPQMLRIAHEHQDAGRPVYIVTAAAHELADVLAHVMAFDGAIGSHLSDVVDGCYTGRATGAFLYREAKAAAIAEIADREGYDLAASYAYSDSASDLPMLEAVGHAVVVNPDSELERLARQRNWEVLRLDPIARRLWTAAGLAAAATAGGILAATIVSRARSERRREPEGWVRLVPGPLRRS
jgi:HAD superfamily hydrolase (TIGR01490 family)